MDCHIIYATTQTASGHHHYRVSPDLSWDMAQVNWTSLDTLRRSALLNGTPPPYVGGCPVKFFSVRAADDPTWPAEQHQHTILLKLLGSFAPISFVPLTDEAR